MPRVRVPLHVDIPVTDRQLGLIEGAAVVVRKLREHLMAHGPELRELAGAAKAFVAQADEAIKEETKAARARRARVAAQGAATGGVASRPRATASKARK